MTASTFNTLAELLELRRHDDSTGILAGDRRFTWREVVEHSEQYAVALDREISAEVRHVGLLMENSPEYLFALFGSALAGITVVGLNTTRRGEELGRDVRHTDCALVLTDQRHRKLLDGVDVGGAPVIEVGVPAWDDALRRTEPPGPRREVTAGDPLLLIFTSGSTSAPKAVIMTNGRAARMASSSTWFGTDDVLYCAMPLFHGNALNAIVFPALASGAAIALRGRFSATHFIDDLRRYRATFFTSVGRALSYVLATPARDADRDHSVKYALAPESSPADVREFRRRFGITCVTGYGSSENAVIMVPVPAMPADALGRPQEGIEAAIVDADTNGFCPPAEFDEFGRMTNAEEAIGEIVGLNVADRFEGYYKNPEAEAERLRNGWFWTGDLGYRDADGFFFFAGRQGDWLRVNSENFATAPVERILGRFDGVAAVAVYAVPDERTADDQVMASLEMADDAPFDPGGFEAFLAAQADLAPLWAPRYVRITDIPVGATNKIDRRRLQRERWYTDDPIYWRPERNRTYVPMTSDDLRALEARFEQHGRAIDRV